MNWIDQYQVFLFDFDGLLVDTEGVHFEAYKELCRQKGFVLEWSFEQFCEEAHQKAMGIWEGLRRQFPQMFELGVTKEALYEEKKNIYLDLLQHAFLELMPGAKEILEQLEKLDKKRAVVTNSPLQHIQIIQKRIPLLQSIPLWVTREDYKEPKPSPEGYLKAIDFFKESKEKVIGFEDSFKGIQALLKAGVKAVLICPSHLSHVSLSVSLGAQHFLSLNLVHI